MTTFIIRNDDVGMFYAGYRYSSQAMKSIPFFVALSASTGPALIMAIPQVDLKTVIKDLENAGCKNISPVLIG